MSRLASEHTRHSSAVGSPGGASAGASTAAAVPLGPARGGASLSGVPSIDRPVPSLRHVVSVLRRFGSGHRSNGVCPEMFFMKIVFNM